MALRAAPAAGGFAPQHLAYLLLITLVWGGTFVAAKIGMSEFPPMLFTGLRFAILVVIALPFIRWHKGQMGRIVGIAIGSGAGHFSLMYTGIYLADDVGPIAIAVQLGVPFTTIMSVIFLGERIGMWRIGGLSFAFVGIVVISFDPRVAEYIDALGFVICAAVFYSAGTILMRDFPGLGPMDLIAWISLISAPILLALSWFVEDNHWQYITSAGWNGWGGMLYTIFGASLVGQIGVFRLLQTYQVSQIIPVTLLAPVWGMLFGVVFLEDVLTWRMLLGGSITLFGVLVIALRQKPRPAIEEEVLVGSGAP